jgi:hypothetical protein
MQMYVNGLRGLASARAVTALPCTVSVCHPMHGQPPWARSGPWPWWARFCRETARGWPWGGGRCDRKSHERPCRPTFAWISPPGRWSLGLKTGQSWRKVPVGLFVAARVLGEPWGKSWCRSEERGESYGLKTEREYGHLQANAAQERHIQMHFCKLHLRVHT